MAGSGGDKFLWDTTVVEGGAGDKLKLIFYQIYSDKFYRFIYPINHHTYTDRTLQSPDLFVCKNY